MGSIGKKEQSVFEGEADIWRVVGAGWKQLSGSFADLGFSFEWHNFNAAEPPDWARSFHPGSLELCLNLTGTGVVKTNTSFAEFTPRTAGFYLQGQVPLIAHRKPNETHQFITVEFRPDFLQRHLSGCSNLLDPLVSSVFAGGTLESGVSTPLALTARQRDFISALRQPPVQAGAQVLWYKAKSLELISEFFFNSRPDTELFCRRQQRVALDRVSRVIALLKMDLVAPPSLEQIAREVACSSFYLSRTFSKEMGQTIPQYVRQLRMEKAALLLRSGEYNVTEAALEVGYNSLSHFSSAFHQIYGCCPGLYPMATSTQEVVRSRNR